MNAENSQKFKKYQSLIKPYLGSSGLSHGTHSRVFGNRMEAGDNKGRPFGVKKNL